MQSLERALSCVGLCHPWLVGGTIIGSGSQKYDWVAPCKVVGRKNKNTPRILLAVLIEKKGREQISEHRPTKKDTELAGKKSGIVGQNHDIFLSFLGNLQLCARTDWKQDIIETGFIMFYLVWVFTALVGGAVEAKQSKKDKTNLAKFPAISKSCTFRFWVWSI
jgi:hypothetical protein